MIPDDTRHFAREKILFLSFTYPSSRGTGSQIRAASLLRMLAAHADVHLVIAGYTQHVSGPPDPAIHALCRQMIHLRIPPAAIWPRANTTAQIVDLPSVDSPQAGAADWIVSYFQKHKLDRLFVFRFDALHFVHPRLDCFPLRDLDLDEVPSRRQEQLDRLELISQSPPSAPTQKTSRATTRLLEKSLIPRFQRLFVSSAVEADEVRRLTGRRALVLPNVYPVLDAIPKRQPSAKSEILFVGSLFYQPNVDAVLYFCREILPLIQRQKKDAVVFRIIGAGGTTPIESIRNQSGVNLLGYQEDLTPYYTQAAVVVVPLRAGAGTRLKILEAFANHRAVVSTTIGAEGLEITDRQNILLADQPQSFAAACVELIDQPHLAEEICNQAAHLHRDLYSDNALLRCYETIQAAEPLASLSANE